MSTINRKLPGWLAKLPTMGKKARRVLLGLARVIHGVGIVAIAALGVAVFTWIPGAEGYLAVLYFLSAVAFVVGSCYLVWCLGGGKK